MDSDKRRAIEAGVDALFYDERHGEGHPGASREILRDALVQLLAELGEEV